METDDTVSRHRLGDINRTPIRRLGCIVASIAFLCFLAYLAVKFSVTNCTGLESRAEVVRTMADLRSYDIALHAYKNDHKYYPEWREAEPPLTTPVAYLGSMIPDRFSRASKGSPESWIHFTTSGTEYLIWSVGPDGAGQIVGKPDLAAGFEMVTIKEYDATNGATSAGDLLRTNPGLAR